VLDAASVGPGTPTAQTAVGSDGPAIGKVAVFVTSEQLILILNDVTSLEHPIRSVKFRLLDSEGQGLHGWQDFNLVPRGRRSYSVQMQRLSLVGLDVDAIASVVVVVTDEVGESVITRSAVRIGN